MRRGGGGAGGGGGMQVHPVHPPGYAPVWYYTIGIQTRGQIQSAVRLKIPNNQQPRFRASKANKWPLVLLFNIVPVIKR